eukprot:11161039-Lingulodinium_polyedra.AAC.1
MRGHVERGVWACPCCVHRWTWVAGGAKRVFAVRVEDQWRLAYIGGASAHDDVVRKIYVDIDKD